MDVLVWCIVFQISLVLTSFSLPRYHITFMSSNIYVDKEMSCLLRLLLVGAVSQTCFGWPWQFWRMLVQVYYRMTINRDLPDIFLVIRLGLHIVQRKSSREVPFYPSRLGCILRTYHCLCWPWSSGLITYCLSHLLTAKSSSFSLSILVPLKGSQSLWAAHM